MSGGSKGQNLSKRSAKGSDRAATVAPYLRNAAEWKGYVNVELSEAEREQFKHFSDDAGLVSEVTASVLLAGYKLSLVQVEDDETYRATAIAGFVGMPDAGYAVSVWQDTPLEAFAAAVFVVGILAACDMSKWVAPETKKKRRTF